MTSIVHRLFAALYGTTAIRLWKYKAAKNGKTHTGTIDGDANIQ